MINKQDKPFDIMMGNIEEIKCVSNKENVISEETNKNKFKIYLRVCYAIIFIIVFFYIVLFCL